MRPLSKFEQIGASITDEQATRSAFFQSLRNIPLYLTATFISTGLIGAFGILGKIIGVVLVVLFAVFALQALFSTSLGLLTFFTYSLRSVEEKQSMQPTWVFLGILVTSIDTIAYTGCIYIIGSAAQWWA